MLSEQKHLICMTMVLGWRLFLDFKFSTLLGVPHCCSANKYSKEAENKKQKCSVCQKNMLRSRVLSSSALLLQPQEPF